MGPVRTTLFLMLALLLPAVRAAAIDLRVTDSRGTEVTVAGASIDYGGFMGSDKVTDGIRILQGDGTVLLKWADVETLKVSKRDESELGDYSIDLDKVRAIAPVK